MLTWIQLFDLRTSIKHINGVGGRGGGQISYSKTRRPIIVASKIGRNIGTNDDMVLYMETFILDREHCIQSVFETDGKIAVQYISMILALFLRKY